MNILGRVSIFPRLPDRIGRMEELAYNLWWSWTPEALALWSDLDSALWEKVYHNPVKFLRGVSQQRLNEVAHDESYLARYDSVMASFDAYMKRTDTWFKSSYPDEAAKGMLIAYFSAEFGLHESLPIYSGGLGVLSGDHCKAASDLDLPFVGVGFLYPQGYFQQRLDNEGTQQALYNRLDLREVPARAALDADGNPVLIQVELPGRVVSAQVWTIQVGRIRLLMLDTDVDPNDPADRELAARLYGGDQEMRVSQEVILGIGGVRALRALGYQPTVWHMNEGHSAFLGLERVRQLVQEQGLGYSEAVQAVRANSLFTTHTPVPAGNDAFAFDLIERYFYPYWPQLGIGRDAFLNLARHDMPWGPQFSMTVLALRLSGRANGVSELHGQVSRDMWKGLWPDLLVDEVPITYVTNGVHQQTWLHPAMEALFDRHLPADWRDHIDDPALWATIRTLPGNDLWQARMAMKEALLTFMRERLSTQLYHHGRSPGAVRLAQKLGSAETLTIGFARRFATYKRATLMFRDEARLQRLLNDPTRPLQFVFSGKAHPADQAGKDLIKQIYLLSQQPEYEGKILFVEDYDMNVARHLVSGVDVWLNNPRRPLEASGTSGEKAAMNGAPNFSVLDGWWREAYNGRNGWAIGQERAYDDPNEQDEEDALSFYTTLEDEIVPLYYAQRDLEGVPSDWLDVVRESIATCTPQFSMTRMVKEYTDKLYVPAQHGGQELAADDYAPARALAAWKLRLLQRWDGVAVHANVPDVERGWIGEPLPVSATVALNGLTPQEVSVEIVSGTEAGDTLHHPESYPMSSQGQDEQGNYRYSGQFDPTHSGRFAYAVRVRPANPLLQNPNELGLVTWA